MASFDVEPFLKISNSPVLSQFLHECVDDLIGRTTANFNNYNSDIEWTLEDYNKARKIIQNIYRNCVIEDNFDVSPNNIAENVYANIKDCYNLRKNEIFQVLVEETLRNGGYNLVKTIDWRLKWILGSSQLATIREPLLQVDLHCVKNNENNVKTRNCVNFEVNLEQLDNLIKQLSDVKKELEKNSDLDQ